MSGADWAWIIAASFWGLLVIALSWVLVAVFRLINEIAALVRGVTSETVPLIGGLNDTVAGVNVELARVDTIIAGVPMSGIALRPGLSSTARSRSWARR